MSRNVTILIVEEDLEAREFLRVALGAEGYRVEQAGNPQEALLYLQLPRNTVDLVLLDCPDYNVSLAAFVKEALRLRPGLPITLLCSSPQHPAVLNAVRAGASRTLARPFDYKELKNAVRDSLCLVEDAPATCPSPAVAPPAPGPLAGQWTNKINQLLREMSHTDVPVLLQGETGVGKEVLARQIHATSQRAKKPFLKLNCAALPAELIESELFGYERGAFTGAFKNTPGKFELADGGTILLDEIGDMDVKLQAKLLQVLQDHEFLRLGAKETSRVDVRVIAATHRDLETYIDDGRFREDLYYRLNVITITLPPLRERPDEILPIANHLMEKHRSPVSERLEIGPALQQALLEHDWPGNIRELENTVRRFLVLRNEQAIIDELRTKVRRKAMRLHTAAAAAMSPPPAPPTSPVMDARANWPTMQSAYVPGALSIPTSVDWSGHPAATSGELAPLASMMAIPAVAPPPVPSPSDPAVTLPVVTVRSDESVLSQVEDARRQAETRAIIEALNSTLWNRKQAAKLLRVDYKALLYKMKKLRIGESVITE